MWHMLRWGILGTGGIAKKFASQNQQTRWSTLTAVASRRTASAAVFAGEYGGKPYAGYENLLLDDEVDAVYVALPNSMHCEWTIRALEAGKHVLCEKPIAANQAEAEQMFAAAEKNGRALVEAFMYRCHRAVQSFIERARGGVVGEIRIIRSNFTFNRPFNPADIRYQADLAGGALMDVGCYPINFARALAGSEPTAMHAFLHQCETGVDDFAVGSLEFGAGPLCAFTCGMCVTADRTTFVGGSEGYMMIDNPWDCNGRYKIMHNSDNKIVEYITGEGTPLYAEEAKLFSKVVKRELEPWITREDSLSNMRVLDQLRQAAPQ